MDGIPLLLLTCLILTERIVDAADCNTKFSEAIFRKNFNYSASSESLDYTASDVFTFGWCAATNTGTPHIDVDFKLPYGISGITIQGPTNKDTNPYPTNVLVKYIPNGGDTNNFIHFPLQEGKLEIKLNQPGQAQSNFGQSIAVRKLRFTIQGFSGEACLKIDLTGCTINELCSGGCQQNGGLCVMEDKCQCPQGSLGDNCELKACVPAKLGLADGRIGADQVTASSQDPVYNKIEIGNNATKKGWCPALMDTSPWVQIKLDQPKAVSIFEFSWSAQGGHTILTEFELQYIAAVDSSRRFRTFATDIPAMNNTHTFSVTITPAVVTDTIRIIPSNWDNRPCFKLEIQGCDPKALCSASWCLNGGSCIGQNVCKCPTGFVGSRCEQASSNITVTNMTFVRIENNIIVTTTATLQFLVIGNVNLQVTENKPVVTINGTDSFITLNQTTGTPSCVTDINHCTNGFTFTIDVNFGQLIDNTYIISSGGNLPDHSGITLYYANNQLHFIVSTTTQIWTVVVNYSPTLHQWQHFELSWSKHLGIEILVNGHTLGSNSRPSSRPTSSKTVSLCIGCSHSSSINVNINMQVTAIHSWSLDRTELVNAGVKEPPATTSIPGSTATSTVATTKSADLTTPVTTTSVVATTTTLPVAKCEPENLGLADGRIGANQINVSSQDNEYNKEEIGNDGNKKGWCPADSDNLPWVQVKLDQPKAVSVFRFSWSAKGSKTILREFELQYIPAIDSARRFRSYAKDIPAMNNTHVLEVTITPAVVTDTIRIIPSKWDIRPCFKLEIKGCDPKALCSAGWCLNGGTCMGQNVCACPSGFVGSRCEQITQDITVTNMTFVRIENNIIVTTTASLQFLVTGNVNLQVIENKPVVSISGTNSFITLNQTTGTPSCVTDINQCTNGFTFTIDVNFGQLIDNTYIISSGGNLPDHSGITLYYANNQLHYIVSTTTQTWTVVVNYSPVLNQWQHFELTWNKHLGIEILVNGHTLGSNSRPSPRPTSSKTVSLCIGCSHSTSVNVNINMQVTAIHSWSLDRTELVNAGVKEPPATTTIPASTTTTTIATTPLPAAKCEPENLGLADGRIGANQINVSSQDNEYNKEEIGNVKDKKGWCPADSDNSSWVQVKLDHPKAVSVFSFYWSAKGSNTILREFELQYIPAIDSTRRFRSYAKDIPAMNNTHVLKVTITPAVVTDTIRIIPSKWDNRPCFKLEIQGCDPKVLCSAGWCMNGGTCMGENVCICPTGFVGSRCEQITSNITVTNMTFVKIENNIIATTTATLQFLVTGNVNLQVIENKPVVSISGTNSFITLNQITGTPSCVTDINHCTNGFTFTIDVNFGQLLDNTYIISSGGNLPDHSGITLYYANNQLHYIVSTTTQIWTVAVNYSPVLHQWQNFELSWNKHLGIEILVNGHTLGSNSRPSPRPTSSKTVNLCIACSHTTTVNVNINMQVSAIHSWSFDRTELVNAGVKEPPVTTTTSNPSTTPKISTAPATSPSTSAPTKTPAPTTTVKATIPTTTQIPVPTFSWNLTTVTNNVIIGSHYNLTVHGSPVVSSAGIQINSSMQYIEFGSHNENCLIKPETCSYGLTIRFTIKFNKYAENTYFFTSGGQLPDGVGLAIVYRFGKIHFILTTANQSWFINCKKNEIPPNKYHTIMLSWQLATGLEVFVNNILVETSKVPDPHQSTLMNATTVYFGKQPTSSVQVDFILQTITIWYVHVDILVEQGKCEPPVRPTTTQSTKVTTAPTKPTATTNRVTFSSLMTTSGPQQCPAGCVSITTAQSSVTTAKPPVTATTRRSTTPVPTTRPKPSATTTSFVPTPDTATPPPPTTRKPIPDFNQFPTIHVTVEKDNNAYIACAFKPSTAKDVQIEASLHVEGKIRLVITVSGNTGLAMFAVSKVDMYLYGKEIKCSVKAHYIGSSLATQSFFSNVFRPLITVSPGRVIVIEGHSKEFVTVTSTAPPQFYCCDGCKGQCQVHIVGTFQYERYFQKCNRDYISQAVIESAKPPNFNEHICGYALTVQNWNQKNKIEIKATIDGRRDGDHTIKLDIIGNVYNQPPTAQITVKPYTFTVTAVQVTVKDNDHGLSQCKSVNDPHMRTFDGQNYDNMREGEFILFRHKTLPFEVRAVYYKCSKRSHATCNCAVAVKSGDDVIAVTGCQGYEGGHPGQGHGIGLLFQQLFGSHGHAHGHNKDELAKTPMTIQIYKNGELTPGTHIRRIGCGQKYEIELPTGMVVTVQQSWKPFINIWIQGSSSDRNQAEGLCGNFDGSRTNDVTPSVSSFINHWKVNNGVFFNGVGVSSHSVTATYCSCVHGKDKVCLAGVGAFRCASLRYDITGTLVQHAKRPVLSRRKRQADTDPVPPSTEIPPDENDFTYEEAEKKCFDTIMNSKVTTSCQPILTSNLTGQIDNCAHDYNATGNFEWAADALRDIIVDCVEAANTLRVANETGNTNVTDEFPDIDNIDEVLGKLEVCLEDCGEHGNCTDGVCVCEDGYSGIHCNISKQTKPTVLSAPYLCDIMDTSDCMAAPIFGDNFVDSDTLNCHYEFLKIGEGVADTGDKGKVRAVYISLNQITCPLPRLQSARLSVSNDGQYQSNNSTIHVVYSSTCFECTVTPTCIRKDNNCLIDGVCYENSVTRPGDNCQICRPVPNSSEWSRNNIDECVSEPVAIVQDNDKEKTQILALAIVCGVLAAIILIGLIFCIKARMGKKSTKGEYGEYDFTGSQNLHRDPFTAVNNLTYDEKM